MLSGPADAQREEIVALPLDADPEGDRVDGAFLTDKARQIIEVVGTVTRKGVGIATDKQLLRRQGGISDAIAILSRQSPPPFVCVIG
jgi:hypothetical protein